ncbi:MAG: AMP-binding protein [Ferruginibacter sp.]|nr:AMP-binding protein [Ferruginibacter sp.]
MGLKFYDVADRYANNIALQYPTGETYSYEQLNKLSNKFAGYLLSKGITKGNVVGIFNEKSVYAFSLMLGCLKIGAIYSNLDTVSPWLRLEKIIGTSKPDLIFFDSADSAIKKDINQHIPLVSCIELPGTDFLDELAGFSDQNPEETTAFDGSSPAYIMFTSGSTGFPKGAVMSHSNVLNFIEWAKQTFTITEADVLTNANPVYFDNSVFDFYSSIYNGATLVPLAHELVKNSRQLVDAINRSKCTLWFSVPSLLVYLLTTRALTKNDFQQINRISFGGEGFPKNKLKQLYDLFGERMTLYNVYGPTECTCICSSYIITEKDFENMNELAPLGYMAPNFSYEILPTEAGNINLGELALIGPCVGLGYYNDAERTGKSFIQNECSMFFQRMYKTGDLVERAGNGYLYFKGRVDNQVKHMGYRIELEEVEAAFSTLPYINEAGVIYEKLSADLGQIRAYVSVADESINAGFILDDIKKILPAYMVPKMVTILPALPKNNNGKIDRKELVQII